MKAELIHMSTRQVRRIAKSYRQHGCHALIHGSRGKVSNRKIRDEVKQEIMSLVRVFYSDFALDIENIKANSPQAKGRVERANQTLQDRLVKEMRLAGISSMEEGNAFLLEYMQKHNRKFAVQAALDDDAHRPVLHDEHELDLIFSKHHKRKLSRNLALQYNNTMYQVNIKNIGYAMRGALVTVCEDFNGKVTLLYQGKSLEYTIYTRGERLPPSANEKTINDAVEQAINKQRQRPKYKPRLDHPWRTTGCFKNRTFLSGSKPDISTLP